MHEASSEIGHSTSLVLPVAHAVTGCDSNIAFSGIGKRSMLNILKSDERKADAILDPLECILTRWMKKQREPVSNLYQTYAWEKERTRVQLKREKIYF